MREVEFQGRELHLLAIIMTDEDDYEAQLAALERELQQDQHSGDLDSNVSMEDLKALEASLEQEDEGMTDLDRELAALMKDADLQPLSNVDEGIDECSDEIASREMEFLKKN